MTIVTSIDDNKPHPNWNKRFLFYFYFPKTTAQVDLILS